MNTLKLDTSKCRSDGGIWTGTVEFGAFGALDVAAIAFRQLSQTARRLSAMDAGPEAVVGQVRLVGLRSIGSVGPHVAGGVVLRFAAVLEETAAWVAAGRP